MATEQPGPPKPHRVVIVGAGFGGLEATFRLAGAPVQITLVDRRNHHLFQPLLYQVATASLATSEIAWPIRYLLRDRKEVKSSVRWQDVDLTQANVRRCVKDGMELTHLGFELVGNDHRHAAIRRWTANSSGIISIKSEIVHQDSAGD
jgi:NADH dehydrogenase